MYRKPENLNCAQSILKAFQAECAVSDEEIRHFRVYGGGRAEGGVCGTLCAVSRLVGENERDRFEVDFKRKFGTVYCHELKRNKTACVECVRLADRFVEEKLDGNARR